MQLLDAIIAFALTMAALATVVTIIMEAGLRIARMRRKNFIEVMKLLNKELESGPLGMRPEERWDFFVKTVRNPAEAAAGVICKTADDLLIDFKTDKILSKIIDDSEGLRETGLKQIQNLDADDKTRGGVADILGSMTAGALTEAARAILSGKPSAELEKVIVPRAGTGVSAKQTLDLLMHTLRDALKAISVARRISSLGREKAAGTNWLKRLGLFVRGIFSDKNRAALYEGVSLEYMLRCLVDIPSVKKASRDAANTLRVEFNRLSQKYEEFGSSVSASFKYYSQRWSIIIGIVLALTANIDGWRIFKAYRADPDLVKEVIAKQDTFIKNHEDAEKSLQKTYKELNTRTAELEKAEKALAQAEKALETANAALKKAGTDQERADMERAVGLKEETLKAQRDAVATARAARDNLSRLMAVEKTMQRAQQQVADLQSLGVPMGYDLIPFNTKWEFCVWFFSVIVSGILIGLGAPFWFDIAKRLSQIRKGLQSAAASSEYRLSAKNANGDPWERKKIVNTVLQQARQEAALFNL